jgi:hypothetical protein
MSTVAVNTITDANGGNNARLNGPACPDNSMGFRNRIINGDMRIDQRNAGALVNPAVNGTYYLDRWLVISGAAGKFSIGQNAGAVTPPAGFTNYLGLTSLSAYAVGVGEVFAVRQLVEGFNAADLGWGTASAQPITLSFWVRSSLTGTFGGSIRNSAQTRTYPFAYSISAANTWEQKTVTVVGDTSGTWLTNNGIGINVQFSIGADSGSSGTAGAWSGSNFQSATGAVSVVGTSGATFFITGVQLEAGSVATPFERRPFGTELALCQRYYSMNGLGNGTAISSGAYDTHPFPVTMRAAPTITKSVAGAIGVDEYAFYFLAPFTTTMSWTASAEL